MAIASSFFPAIRNSSAELAGQPLVKRGTALVEPGERDGGAMFAIFGLDRIQRRDARGVPDLGMGEIDGDPLGIDAIGEAFDEIVAAAEEQRPVHVIANRKPIRADRTFRAN